MPPVLLLALLLGYVVGIGSAFWLLPIRLLEPLYLPIMILTVVLAVAVLLVYLLVRRRHRHEHSGPQATPPGARRTGAATRPPWVLSDGERPGPAPGATHSDVGSSRLEGHTATPVEAATITAQELREALYHGRVDVTLRPIDGPPDDGLDYRTAIVRVETVDRGLLPPGGHLAPAARAGLLVVLDRTCVLRCTELVRHAAAEARPTRVLCRLDRRSLAEADLVGLLEAFAGDHPELAARLVVEIDHARLEPLTRRAIERLRDLGFGLCLERVAVETIDPDEARAAGANFVKLRLPDSSAAPARTIAGLRQTLGAAGIALLVDRLDDASAWPTGRIAADTGREPSAA